MLKLRGRVCVCVCVFFVCFFGVCVLCFFGVCVLCFFGVCVFWGGVVGGSLGIVEV